MYGSVQCAFDPEKKVTLNVLARQQHRRRWPTPCWCIKWHLDGRTVATVFNPHGSDVVIDDFHDLNRLRDEGGQRGLMILNVLIGMGWSHWLKPGMFRTPNNHGVYMLLCDLVRNHCEGLLHDDTTPSAAKRQGHRPAHGGMLDNVQAFKGWNVRIHDDFWVVGMDDDGTLLVPDLNRNMVYKVLGVHNAIYPMLQSRGFGRPVLVRLTIIPFYGRLVYDGVITGTMIQASPALSEKLTKNVDKAVVSLNACDNWRSRVDPWIDCRSRGLTWRVAVLLLLLLLGMV
jgi:hypothetical protein